MHEQVHVAVLRERGEGVEPRLAEPGEPIDAERVRQVRSLRVIPESLARRVVELRRAGTSLVAEPKPEVCFPPQVLGNLDVPV